MFCLVHHTPALSLSRFFHNTKWWLHPKSPPIQRSSSPESFYRKNKVWCFSSHIKMVSGSGMEPSTAAAPSLRNGGLNGQLQSRERCGQGQGNWQFQMPLHYPRYTKADYKNMLEWKLDCLLHEYGLPVAGDLDYKHKFAMGSFLWIN